MSAPQTNIEKQTRRHKGPLLGISVGVVAVLVVLAWYAGVFVDDPQLDAEPAALTSGS